MPKKHLLYIHFPQFEEEERKSHLVNKLLADHYGEALYVSTKRTKVLRPVNDVRPMLRKITSEPCEHGAARGMCRFSECSHSMFNPRNKL